MSAFALRPCLYVGDNSIRICSRWKPYTRKLQQPGLQLPHLLKSTLKTSKWNQSQWPGKKDLVNSAELVVQNNYALSRLWKPFAFTLAVSGTSLVVAAVVQYENIRSQAIQARRQLDQFPTLNYGQFWLHMQSWWHSLKAEDKMCVPICAINVLVYLAWKVPAWQSIMAKYFTTSLAPGPLCWPMLLSVFSHNRVFNLIVSMYLLHSFADGAVKHLGKEQCVAMYLSAGMVSSFTSYLFKAMTKSSSFSLGANGAVLSVISYFCFTYPDSTMVITPNITHDASTGIAAIVGIDTAGCIYRWTFLDHAAHLGGSFFGIFWYALGQELIWEKSKPLILQLWVKIREPVQ